MFETTNQLYNVIVLSYIVLYLYYLIKQGMDRIRITDCSSNPSILFRNVLKSPGLPADIRRIFRQV